ncbi:MULTISPECIES: hypothetical protein [Rhodonellum]|nr:MULTISPECIES: hypothetical protein [Rhodonellum]
MRKTILLLVMGLVLLSCRNEEEKPISACGVSNPASELPWLATKLAEMESGSLRELFYVAQTELNGQTLFIFGNCCAVCNSIIPVYNCEGEVLGLLGAQDGIYGFELLSDSRIISKYNSCQIGAT